MSKSKKRKQFAALALGLFGAQKLGMLGGATKAKSDIMRKASSARLKGITMPKAKVVEKLPAAAAPKKIPGKVVDKTTIQSPFKMFQPKRVGSNMPSKSNLERFKAANKAQMERKFGSKTKKVSNSSAPGFFGLKFDKPMFKKGKMIKARGGGMARTKPTKMY